MKTIKIQIKDEMFSFGSEQEWINKAQSWFSNYGLPHGHYICVDNIGRVCTKGSEFMRATREETYPIKVYELLI